VAAIQRPCARRVGPLGEAGPPPLFVLGNRMELREIEGDYARSSCATIRQCCLGCRHKRPTGSGRTHDDRRGAAKANKPLLGTSPRRRAPPHFETVSPAPGRANTTIRSLTKTSCTIRHVRSQKRRCVRGNAIVPLLTRPIAIRGRITIRWTAMYGPNARSLARRKAVMTSSTKCARLVRIPFAARGMDGHRARPQTFAEPAARSRQRGRLNELGLLPLRLRRRPKPACVSAWHGFSRPTRDYRSPASDVNDRRNSSVVIAVFPHFGGCC
jgi:hypothetical protein